MFFLSIYITQAKFTTNYGKIFFDNSPIQLRGINWYGLETNNMVMEGLWAQSIDSYLDYFTNNSFNALRIPFSVDLIMFHRNEIPRQDLVSADPEIYNKTSIEILDLLFEKTKQRGLGILLDCHRISMRNPVPLWYMPNNKYFTDMVFYQSWMFMIDRYANQSNLIGIEIYNEPHDNATMGTNDYYTDVSIMYQNILYLIMGKYNINIDFLIFLDGINWGKDFRGLTDINPFLYSPLLSQIVYSPHIYGPTLTALSNFTIDYVTSLYNTYFGFLKIKWNLPICITEWGINTNNKEDLAWVDLFIEYLTNNNMTDNFFWALNPEGKDIKGLVADDWKTTNLYKFGLIERLVPTPTKFIFT